MSDNLKGIACDKETSRSVSSVRLETDLVVLGCPLGRGHHGDRMHLPGFEEFNEFFGFKRVRREILSTENKKEKIYIFLFVVKGFYDRVLSLR